MRISDSMITDLSTRGVEKNRQELFEAQRVAMTGVRVEKPSDDPVAAALARKTHSRERRSETVAKTSGHAVDRLQAVDDALSHVGDVLTRARELAVLGANDHLSADERTDLAVEVSALRDQLLALANTKIEDDYVFAGLATDRAPFDATGAFLGETTLRVIDVGNGVRLPVQVNGSDAFGTSAGGVNAFTALDSLAAALNANDGGAVHALIDELGEGSRQVARARTTAGTAMQGLTQARAVAERVRDDAIARRSHLTESNQVEAFTELVRAEGALRDALGIAARLPPPSLTQGG